ncbi:hypothetical protein K1T71_009191 [Dendrolimus kikuchii]|uniref:Uncharacterized protein n=1 Tax=Dendrolimus kikuchii TaxID=765133 RepID=A0ACC1CTV5_9NEOP|nr:hypothetical protein K1T71_009191 [Dendrolimus kikuchii]
MKFNILLFLPTFIYCSLSLKTKNIVSNKTIVEVKKNLEQHEEILIKVNKNKSTVPVRITDYEQAKIKPQITKKGKVALKIISPEQVDQWAKDISKTLRENDRRVVRREVLAKNFSQIRAERRNGTAIVNKLAVALEDLLTKRIQAAEEIMRKAEELAVTVPEPPFDYTFMSSVDLDQTKKQADEPEEYELPMNCTDLEKVKLSKSKHFDSKMSLETTSVYVVAEVFACDPRVVEHLHWSENLLQAFQKNYAQDASIHFQYFCSVKGFLRHYPAALWSDMYKLKLDIQNQDVYDCRLRPWYVSAGGAPRDVLILVDASGSMHNSSNQVVSEQFTSALLNALTDDDQVNVLRFNVAIESPISCFNEKLVPANHVNSAAMMSALKFYKMRNETHMADVLEYAVHMLRRYNLKRDRPSSCQQAIVLLTDSMYDNYTDLMKELDPHGRIRLFVMWLHDRYGLRDNTRAYADWISCNRDGYFAELITHNDVTEQVMRILRVMERPLVAQRQERLRVFSDVYAHVEDPRRSEYYWKQKENWEQMYRYKELRKNKATFLSPERLYSDYMYQYNLDKRGYYYEGQDLNYRLQISVSVPVFDSNTSENITIMLDEEKQRNSTRTYPVNRLLGVAGVDIPIDHLKLILPYHQLGGGASLFIVDHRGNIVLHDNLKPTFDGDILKPGYRTVDFLDLEQPAQNHKPRYYPPEWIKLRNEVIIENSKGQKKMEGKNIYENGMRANLELREYHWKRVLDHYTAVVVLPPYNRVHAVPRHSFTKDLAEEALKSLSRTEFAVHPDWLYCQHVEPYFDSREAEVRHFVRRRSDEPNFAMRKLRHVFSPIVPALLEKTYHCDEELMARICKEAIMTDQWAREHEQPDTDRDCSTCELGSTTAFFVTDSGLTRWQQYHATTSHAEPPNGSWWSRGPDEPWYRRAVASPGTLIVHIPIVPVRNLRNSFKRPPTLDIRSEWLTAAMTLNKSSAIIGVAGYHFHPEHLADLLKSVTNFPENCAARCDGITWSCVLIDEGGWVVSREGRKVDTEEGEEPVTEHLATLHPAAMAALLKAEVFQLSWIHDYQGVCFPPKDEKLNAAPTMPSIVRSLFRTVHLLYQLVRGLTSLFVVMNSGVSVLADTEKEKKKRRDRLRRDYEREKYERLYDNRVLINRTKFAACDRSRPIYILQNTPKAMESLKRQFKACEWPLVAAQVPETNLLLIAVYNRCTHKGSPVPDPLINEMYLEETEDIFNEVPQSSASKLACWRNRMPMATRQVHTKCYPHNYSQEIGYRQCGPWMPDPPKKKSGAIFSLSKLLLFITICLYLS